MSSWPVTAAVMRAWRRSCEELDLAVESRADSSSSRCVDRSIQLATISRCSIAAGAGSAARDSRRCRACLIVAPSRLELHELLISVASASSSAARSRVDDLRADAARSTIAERCIAADELAAHTTAPSVLAPSSRSSRFAVRSSRGAHRARQIRQVDVARASRIDSRPSADVAARVDDRHALDPHRARAVATASRPTLDASSR